MRERKRTMKKIIAFTLVAGMIVALSGCGKTNQGADQTQKQTDAVKRQKLRIKRVLILLGFLAQRSRNSGNIKKLA